MVKGKNNTKKAKQKAQVKCQAQITARPLPGADEIVHGEAPGSQTACEEPKRYKDESVFDDLIVKAIFTMVGVSFGNLINFFGSNPHILYLPIITTCLLGTVFAWRRFHIPRLYFFLAMITIWAIVLISVHMAVNWKLAKDADNQQKEDNWRRSEADKSSLMAQAEASELLHRFPLGCTLFTMVQSANGPFATITDTKRIVPPEKYNEPGYLTFDWMLGGHASIGDELVVLSLPTIIFENNIIGIGNSILLRRAVGVALTLDVNPAEPPGLFRGNTISSDEPGRKFALSKNPTVSIVVEIRAVIDNGATMILGLKPYKADGAS
jgi:hypothetical protein